jgi:DNA polymerase III alpha subunit
LAARKRLYNWTLRKLVASQTTQGFTDLASFCEATRKRAIGNRVIEIMVHPGSLRSAEETVLLESGWEEELPFPVRLINYNELGE